ncbi:MAG: glycosyltransferase family 39 protein [Pseudomonadota bacterium]|nr:glycosyltransferase family 39 protein [Pseudomonadota bacterium]
MYWDWSIKKAYTLNSIETKTQLLERMPASFLFFQFSIWLLGENLFSVLLMQIFIDSINCLIIAYIAKSLNKKLFFLAGILASISPLMIIISSQILSDTIFLFFFSCYIYFFLNLLLNKNKNFFYYAGVFLGLSLFTRVTVLPLIFITLIISIYIFYKNKIKELKIVRLTFTFLFISFSLSFPRIFNNYITYNTTSLTSQSGAHLAYWLVPGVLDFENNEERLNYKKKIQQIEKKIENETNPFINSALLKEEALNTLFSANKKSIFFAWSKGIIYNTFSPPILLDKRIRSLPHPSFYNNNRNLKKWLTKLFFDNTFKNYRLAFVFSFITSGIFLVLLLFGILVSLKNYFSQSLIFYLILLYFFTLTGPVFSPKYIHPLLPFFIFFESLGILKLRESFSKFFKKA